MEHWSKTSSVEPLPLGRRQNKRKMEVGLTSTDQCHFSDTRIHKGQKVYPVVRVPHGVLRRPVDAATASRTTRTSTSHADAPEIQVDHINSPKFMRNMICSLENGVNQKLLVGKEGTTWRADGNEDHRQKTQEMFIPKDYSKSSVVSRPSIASTISAQGKMYQKNVATARNKVMEILGEFRAFCDHISRADKLNNYKRKRVDFLAAKMIKKKFPYYTSKPILGPVPGVEIGDKFLYRMELNILGLHRPWQGGIEYMQHGGEIVATSIVDSGGYDNYMASQDTLIYCGQGGNNTNANVGQEVAEDQELKGGNLALLNSIRVKNPVRVIRGSKVLRASSVYFYDGLYTVEKMWEDKGLLGKRVFKFKLVKMAGQGRRCGKVKD